jgi:hypothetical protein
MVGNLNPDLIKLEQLRNAAVNASTQALNKTLTDPKTAASLQTPNALDDMAMQKSRMDTIRTQLLREWVTLRALYPYSSQALQNLGAETLRNAGLPTGVDMVNPTRGLPMAKAASTSAASAAPVTITSREEFDRLPSGAAFTDSSGKVKYKK